MIFKVRWPITEASSYSFVDKTSHGLRVAGRVHTNHAKSRSLRLEYGTLCVDFSGQSLGSVRKAKAMNIRIIVLMWNEIHVIEFLERIRYGMLWELAALNKVLVALSISTNISDGNDVLFITQTTDKRWRQVSSHVWMHTYWMNNGSRQMTFFAKQNRFKDLSPFIISVRLFSS